MTNTKGKIISIKGQIVEVEFLQDAPHLNDVLIYEAKRVYIEVYSILSSTRFSCLALSPTHELYRGAELINTAKSIEIPAGKEILGRVVDIKGNVLDGKGELKAKETINILDENETTF